MARLDIGRSLLQRTYSDFNKRWFSGKLPYGIEVKWKRDMSPLGTYDDNGIRINAAYKKETMIWKLTLLHEMAHVATDSETAEHGPRWKREMRRLARIGAFDNLW